MQPVIEPSSLFVPDWDQETYVSFWSSVIERFAASVILADGWTYSAGAIQEAALALRLGRPVHTEAGAPIDPKAAYPEIQKAIEALSGAGIATDAIEKSLDVFRAAEPERLQVRDEAGLRKDKALDHLAERINVAQFISYAPLASGLEQQYCRVAGEAPNTKFQSLRSGLELLLARSPDGMINLRSFKPDDPQSKEFIYGLTDLDVAEQHALRLGREGLHVIANETVDIHDGGVSGVLMHGVNEFAPDDTPRCVEKPGIASLPSELARRLLNTVYSVPIDLAAPLDSRLEYSVHPVRRGWRQTHTLGWEFDFVADSGIRPGLDWPNRFSRLLGDKVYGLLVAHLIGLEVPLTTVINRRIAPFSFGVPTGRHEIWARTAPHEQLPGYFTTQRGWLDPFELFAREDPEGVSISSLIAQREVDPVWSGAALVASDGSLVVEGVSGSGERFMQGSAKLGALPESVQESVRSVHERASAELGPVRMEWVFDGARTWVVQLHRGASVSCGSTVVPGDPVSWMDFDVSNGLEALRLAANNAADQGQGIRLSKRIGLTSHMADVLRRAGVPAVQPDL